MAEYRQMITPVNHIDAVPRRIRAVLAGEVVLDTTAALYVWEWASYPHYYIPIAGPIAFFNEKVDVTLDGVLLDRPSTHFFI